MDISLRGKYAVVAGSTQGIGLAIARTFAEQGATVIMIARNEAVLKEQVELLETPFEQVHAYYMADFTDPKQVENVIGQVCAKHPIEILINNTGGPPAGPIIDATEEAFVDAFNQHLVCNHILTRAVVPCMKSAGYGRIINIISTSVKIPLKNLGVSNTIRGAVASWAKTMSLELGQFNITVNNILPGYTETARLDSLISVNAEKRNIAEDVVRAEMLADIPMQRFGKATETAAVAGFLASPAASYVNGVSIPVDGGRTGTI
ncbi:MAG TPA: SDR family oxidoreductase [Flavitalea sp.]|nr:SDR family oxidoreductase [Flavitalea sp.]